MRHYSLCLAMILLSMAACGKHSGPVGAAYGDADMVIFAAIQPSVTGRKLHVAINGDVVIKDHSRLWGSLSQMFVGEWGGRKVVALMQRGSIAPTSATFVDVFIDNQLVKRIDL